MLNEYRKGVSDTDAKQIIDDLYPDLKRDLEEYEMLWEDAIEASKAKSISHALAILADRDPEIVLRLHKINPWKPTPDEATLLMAFGPNLVSAVVLTFEDQDAVEDITKDNYVTEDFLSHMEKVTKDVYSRSKEELDAVRRGV